MKDSEKQWLIQEFPKHKGKTVRGDIAKAYYEAERILNGWTQIKRRGCGCELGGMAKAVDNSYNKWISNNGLQEKTSSNIG